jgi:formyltetrahydrofolate deformylase
MVGMNVLRLQCDDKPGIVAAVAATLANNECNIEESSQFHDAASNQFFMRVVFSCPDAGCSINFHDRFGVVAQNFGMQWRLCDLTAPVRTLVLVSKAGHCLHDMLYRWQTRHLPIDITGVVSNHLSLKIMADTYGLPFHYLPVSDQNRREQEAAIEQIAQQTDTELLVLARYMQVLSDEFCSKHEGRVINIHHSFLPGFKGARPYHQAYDRGVKIIGATAHFATPDLDEGPIIAQDTAAVDHTHSPEALQLLGQDNESRVMNRAVRLYGERRIFVHGLRTVIL